MTKSERSGYRKSREGVEGTWSGAIDALFAARDQEGLPGLALAVMKEGAVVHARGYGVAEIEHDIPFAPETVLRMGSTSKHICAACIYLLEREGRISVEDDVRKHVPELSGLKAPVTVDHLLTMSSGLMEWLSLPIFAGMRQASPVRRVDFLAWLTRLTETMFPPGATSSYSNTNYALLSLIVERVSGQPLADFMRDRLFAPLGMTDTRLVTHMSEVVPNMAKGYDPGPEGVPVLGFMLPEIHGEGAVNTTLADMTRWYCAYREDRIAPGLRAWLEAGRPLNDGSQSPYRRGIIVDTQGGIARVGHAGGMPGHLCEFAHFLGLDIGIAMLTNWMDPALLAQVDPIAEIVSGRRFAEKVETAHAPPPGFYASETTGDAIAIASTPDGVACHCLGEDVPLRADGPRRWRFAKRGDARALSMGEKGGLLLHNGALPPAALTSCGEPLPVADPAHYVGVYWCRSLGEHQIVTWDGAHLAVTTGAATRPMMWSRLVRRTGEFFVAPIEGEDHQTNVTLRFERDAKGSVRGFDYTISRISGLRFEKVSDAPW